jgi:PAS domain S-box-containing protein
MTLGLAIGGFYLYSYKTQVIRTKKHQELNTITRLKLHQITQWRKEHINDASILSEDMHLSQSFESWQRRPNGTFEKFYLQNRLQSIQKNNEYQRVILTNPEGKILLSYPSSKQALSHDAIDWIREVMLSKTTMFGGFFYNPKINRINVKAFVPLINAAGKAVAVAVIVIDPYRFFYPLIKSWPIPSSSAETLIVRKKGGQFLVLNELRHRNDTAMKLTFPITKLMRPSVQIVPDNTGLFKGIDYRGVDVLAQIQPIGHSNWLMVTKVDTQEFLAQAHYLFFEIIVLVCVASLLTGLSISLLYFLRQNNILKKLYRTQHQLAKKAMLFQNTFYSIDDGVVIADSAGVIRQMNPAAQTLSGWNEKEAIDKPLEQVLCIIDKVSGVKVENPITQILKTGYVIKTTCQTLIVDKNGIERPVSHKGTSIRDLNDDVVGVVLILRNLVKTPQIEPSLSENRTQLNLMLENSPLLIYLIDPKGKFLMANQKMASILDYPADQIIDKPVEDFASNKLIPKRKTPNEYLSISSDPQVEEVEMEDDDGKHIYLTTKFPVHDTNGNLLALGGISTDVTYHRFFESTVDKEMIEYQKLVESAPNHFYMLSLKGVYLYSNDRLVDIKLSHENHILGKKIEDVIDSKTAALFRSKLDHVIKTHKSIHFEYQTSDVNGHLIRVENTFYPIIKEEKIWAIGGLERIITACGWLDNLYHPAEKIEAIHQLVGDIAYDFNKMLAVIIKYAKIYIKDLVPTDPLYDDLNNFLMAACRSKEITDPLLVFAHRKTIVPQIINLSHKVHASKGMLKRLLGKNIDLKINPDKELWPVNIDPSQLLKILVILAINTKDTTDPKGTITIDLTNIVLDEELCQEHIGLKCGEFVLLTFQDRGLRMEEGIPKKRHDPLFTTKANGEGNGFSLSTAYEIVKQNNGFMAVHSKPGSKSTFKIFLPRVLKKDDE